MKMLKSLALGSVALSTSLLSNVLTSQQSQAAIIFSFQQVGSDVTMTSSGSIDTAGLVAANFQGWGDTGVEENGQTDLMGGTNAGSINLTFSFNPGTDFSAWQTGNPFDNSFFGFSVSSGSKGFSTYSRDASFNLVPGLGVRDSDLNGTVWSPDQNWIATGQTLASIGLNPGTYTVTDAVSGESITYQVVPEPLTMLGAGAAVAFGAAFKRRKA